MYITSYSTSLQNKLLFTCTSFDFAFTYFTFYKNNTIVKLRIVKQLVVLSRHRSKEIKTSFNEKVCCEYQAVNKPFSSSPNKLVSTFVVSAAALALLSNQNNNNAFKFIFFKTFHKETFPESILNCQYVY